MGILSALTAGEDGARYDGRAAFYDRVIGSALYNRLAWGTSKANYETFAREALAAADGPFLDAGCGTGLFTAAAYRSASRSGPIVLVDRSMGMLERAAERLVNAPTTLVHADLLDLPFAPHRFAAVGCFGILHVLDDPWPALAALHAQLAAGGRLFASMLVADRPVGRAYLGALHRRGEVGPPRRAHELADAARAVFGAPVAVTRTGSMAWLRATRTVLPS